MANDSSTPGYVLPTGDAPTYDAALDAIFQQMIVGLTGMQGSLVRPRWQPVMPKQPEPNVDWCAIGVTLIDPDAGPAFVHDSTGDGQDVALRHESIDVLCSFYGPNAAANAALVRDAIAIPQNNNALEISQIAFVEVGRPVPAPDLINQQWMRRWDVPMSFRRKTQRTYPILNIESFEISIGLDTGPVIDITTPD